MKSMRFFFQNALVWTAENDSKTLVWIKIFCFVFVETKTDTFENALVRPRRKIYNVRARFHCRRGLLKISTSGPCFMSYTPLLATLLLDLTNKP